MWCIAWSGLTTEYTEDTERCAEQLQGSVLSLPMSPRQCLLCASCDFSVSSVCSVVKTAAPHLPAEHEINFNLYFASSVKLAWTFT